MELPIVELPEDLEISTQLLEEERSRVGMKFITKLPDIEKGGLAYHEKAAKNSKVNVRRDHAKEMKLKYGKQYRRNDVD
jgi:ATP-dependent RNA helicase RhlE